MRHRAFLRTLSLNEKGHAPFLNDNSRAVKYELRGIYGDSCGKNICLPTKEVQTRIHLSIVLSIFCSPMLHFICNFVYSVADNSLRTEITLKSFHGSQNCKQREHPLIQTLTCGLRGIVVKRRAHDPTFVCSIPALATF